MTSQRKVEKLISKLQSQSIRLQLLSDLEEISNSTTNIKVLLKEILSLTVRVIQVQYGFVVFYDKGGHEEFKLAASNEADAYPDKELLKLISADVIKNHRPVIINDTKMHKRLRHGKVKNIIALPLMFNKEPTGTFIILNKRKPFKKRDLALFSIICRFSSTALQHAKGYQELEEKNKELDVIYTVDQIRDTIKDFNVMMETVLQELARVIDAKLAFFMLYNRKSNKTDLKVSGKLKSSVFVKNNTNVIYELTRSTLNNGETMEFGGLNHDIYSALCTPVMIDNDTMGVFGVINSNNTHGFSSLDKKVLNAVAKQADSAVFEDMEKSALKGVFQRYVSPEVIEQMLNEPEKDYMKVQRHDISVLFSDLRGFTALSDKLAPEKIATLLNEHFDAMTQCILRHRGTLDKFVGDEVMAFFGAPIHQEAHALKAIKAALDMQHAQMELEKKWKKEGITVRLGIGINTGDAVVGNIGCNVRTDYTVIGDAVNIAARLCSAAAGGQILISEDTYQEVKKSVRVEKLAPIQVKGKSKPIQIYSVTGLLH
ncbi:GAF domain-containing protein [Candidatus Woesearchaeota archaeon]|nr:GAF domain-containing protein [Candidatus Woesearchaeota archaeon]